jgi:hypothetical protein
MQTRPLRMARTARTRLVTLPVMRRMVDAVSWLEDTPEAKAISTLINAGYSPDSVIAAIRHGDIAMLKHTGEVIIQVRRPHKPWWRRR